MLSAQVSSLFLLLIVFAFTLSTTNSQLISSNERDPLLSNFNLNMSRIWVGQSTLQYGQTGIVYFQARDSSEQNITSCSLWLSLLFTISFTSEKFQVKSVSHKCTEGLYTFEFTSHTHADTPVQVFVVYKFYVSHVTSGFQSVLSPPDPTRTQVYFVGGDNEYTMLPTSPGILNLVLETFDLYGYPAAEVPYTKYGSQWDISFTDGALDHLYLNFQGNGQYQLTLYSSKAGNHSLLIKLNGTSVSREPLPVFGYAGPIELCFYVKELSHLKTPNISILFECEDHFRNPILCDTVNYSSFNTRLGNQTTNKWPYNTTFTGCQDLPGQSVYGFSLYLDQPGDYWIRTLYNGGMVSQSIITLT